MGYAFWQFLYERCFHRVHEQAKAPAQQFLRVEALEDRFAPASVQFAIANDWGSGFQAEMALVNEPTSPAVSDWRLEFDYAANISSIWNAKISEHVGTHYTITAADWNKTVAAGSEVSFGFIGSPGNTTSPPTNYVLNGVPLGKLAAPTLSIDDVSANEGNTGISLATFQVRLNAPAAGPVSVGVTTRDGTAQAGSDYQPWSGTLTFAPGETQKSVTVPILGDTVYEPDETFSVSLANPVNAVLGDAQATGTIRNDDAAPPVSTGNVEFKVTSDWSSGFTGDVTIRNSTATEQKNWSLEFDFAGQISSIWNASVVSHDGTHYVVKSADWNSTIAAGGSVAFGFTGSPGGQAAVLSNFVLHATGVTQPPVVNQPPVANPDFATTQPGVAATINVLANDSDPNGDPLAVATVSQGQHGNVTLNPNATLAYVPVAGFTGSDIFQYTASDGNGGSASATVSVTVVDAAVSAWPAQVFAPYVDMTLYPTYDLVATARNEGIRFFTLAFIVADERGAPSWGGYQAYEVNGGEFDSQIKSQLAGLRSLGGDVVVSFGGAANQELALVITDVNALTRAYQTVIDAYQLTRIDFDIEGAAAADHASIDRRNQAIARLQQQAATTGSTLTVWYTLPVLPTGLTSDGLYVLQSALRYGVNLGGVNIMAMDYGDWAAPSPQGRMGDYAIQAATSVHDQLQILYGSARTSSQLWQMIGVTPMIGLNDVTTEVFDQQEARELAAWADQVGIGELSMWSLNRDRQDQAGTLGYVTTDSSSVLQQPFEFSAIFQSFAS